MRSRCNILVPALVVEAGNVLSINPSDQKLELNVSHIDPCYWAHVDALEYTLVRRWPVY